MRRSCSLVLLVLAGIPVWAGPGEVEIIRDQWGVPHVYAETEADGFFGVGYATAEDRIVQMELFRRRSRGRLAEIFGRRLVASDRKFRLAEADREAAVAALNQNNIDVKRIKATFEGHGQKIAELEAQLEEGQRSATELRTVLEEREHTVDELQTQLQKADDQIC